MRKVLAWLGVATLFTLVSVRAEADNVLKPYVVLILDTSDSMLIQTGSGPTSCGKGDTRLNHAVCAINNIANSYGDMVLALARFRETVTTTSGTQGSLTCDANGDQNGNPNDTTTAGTGAGATGGDQCNTQGAVCSDCNPESGGFKACAQNADCRSNSCGGITGEAGAACTNNVDDDGDGRINDGCTAVASAESGVACLDNLDNDSDGTINDGCPANGQCTGLFGCVALTNGAGAGDRNFELLSPLADGLNSRAAEFTDGSCNTCNTDATGTLNPEIWGVGRRTFTPLAGALAGAKRYWEGNQATDGTPIWAAADPANMSANNLGFDPINRDPAAAVFLPGNDATSCNPEVATCTAFTAETGAECTNSTNDDAPNDLRINDGCPAVGAPETGAQCADGNVADEDNDGVVNDGCPAWCAGSNCCCGSQCRPYVTILLADGDETCSTFSNTLAATSAMLTSVPRNDAVNISSITRSGAGAEANCTDAVDNDGDGRINDGCVAQGALESLCDDALDNDNDGRVNDGCPAVGLVTVTTLPPAGTTLPHPFAAGDEILVAGVSIGTTSFNGTFFVRAVLASNQITYLQQNATTANETRTGSGNVRHTASRYRYRVETKPIGFGIEPGNANIEAIAHAGGAPDLPGINEGYYAQNEAELQLAISQILADSVRAELCNNADDDCDTQIDEDFPNKGGTCSNGLLGACAANGTLVCRADGAGLQCNAPIIPPGTEGPACDGIDNDCDGLIDDGLNCGSCTPLAETCNGADQDCDGVADQSCRCSSQSATPGAICTPNSGGGAPCAGQCVCTPLTRPCGIGVCAGTETCTNGQYTGCTAVSGVEECDGEDNDCDGLCDGFNVDCSEQVVGAGNCNPNVTNSCPASDSLGSPLHPQNQGTDAAEVGASCTNNLDDDMDGLVNDGCPAVGAAETGAACSDAMDSDADGTINDGCPVPTLPLPQNVCRPGARSCPINNTCNGTNQFSTCSGEVLPCTGANCDVCNGLDDDCDNKIDEGFIPADCSTNCGQGQTQCINGQITCNSTPQSSDNDCDNNDDDCDGEIDEDWVCPDVNPADGMCDECTMDSMGNQVCMGEPRCIMGNVECVGGPVNNETCNCLDDDCDSVVDDGNLCPSGSACVNCQCAFACAAGEFPCPLGKKCEVTPTIGGTPESMCVDSLDNDNDGTVNDGCPYCVNDPCFNVTCPAVNGNQQTCIPKPGFPNEPQCVDTCSLVNDSDNTTYPQCAQGFVCFGPAGECRPDNCTTFPDRCTGDQTCVNGTCVSNPCAGVTCDQGQYCVGGNCVPSCSDVTCPTGQRCRLGACETDPCGGPCPFGQACNDTTGQCINDPCKVRTCFDGQWCNPNSGQCEEDPCETSQITCPNATDVCRGGTCIDEDTLRPDAAGEVNVTVGGGGGCSTTGGGSGLLLALGLLFLSRRRRRSRSVGGAL